MLNDSGRGHTSYSVLYINVEDITNCTSHCVGYSFTKIPRVTCVPTDADRNQWIGLLGKTLEFYRLFRIFMFILAFCACGHR